MRNYPFIGRLKSILAALLIVMLCMAVSPMTVTAEEFYNDDPDNYIKDVKISNLSFYDDGSLKSFDIAVTPACDAYDNFDAATAHGAISIHTKKFGISAALRNEDDELLKITHEAPTDGMKYYLYNGTVDEYGDDKYIHKDTPNISDDDARDGYWENYLYQDYSCSKIGSMMTCRPIKDIAWDDVPVGEQFPQDCYFESWGQDKNGNVQLIDLTIGEFEYITTEATMYFTKGKIIPSEKQVFYVYLWNQWTNKDENEDILFYPPHEDIEDYEDYEWSNPTGIYPDRYIFTLSTGNGIIPDSVTDTLEISGETTVGKTLSANITDKDNNAADQYWANYQWTIDGKTVGNRLTYEVKDSDAGKEITFTCVGASEGRTGLLMASAAIDNTTSADQEELPTEVTAATNPADPTATNPTDPENDDASDTGDSFDIMPWLILATASMLGIVVFATRRRAMK